MIVSFSLNKYTTWYNQIINQRRQVTPVGYVERHHVIPSSLGGTNDPQNIVKLTAREHFVCHRLLTRMFAQGSRERQKMSLALHKMAYGTSASKYCVTSSQYEVIRALNGEAIHDMQKERFKDPKVRAKQVEYALHASQVAAERNRGNPEFSESCSARTKRHVNAGTHNFLGGELQKAMWDDPEFRERQHQLQTERVTNGTHTFQQPEFIKAQRTRVKDHWANMTSEERVERGRRISEGRQKGAIK